MNSTELMLVGHAHPTTTDGLDEPGDLVPMSPFVSEVQLTVNDLFAWLLE